MCTATLLRRLGAMRCPLEPHSGRAAHGASLGSWAAKAFKCDGVDLVVGLNLRTYLTVVFPFAPRALFRQHFASALAQVLEALRVPRAIVRAEATAVEFGTLGRLTDRSTIGALSDVQFFGELELSYHQDLQIVQWNLNQLPRAGRDPCVPSDAVIRLFGAAPAELSSTLH